MRMSNITEVNEFISAVNKCSGKVWLESSEGDVINLKSQLSQYIALSALLSDKGEGLMLYCALPEDESRFFKFFKDHPETV